MFKKTEERKGLTMPNTRKGSKFDLYNSHFASTLRDLMDEHKTTQKELAEFVGVRPQTLSLYCTGETQPNVDKLLKIAEYFNVTTDYLITGTVIEDIPVREMLGFSERTVENLKLVKDDYFEDSPYMLPLLDCLLGEKGFYTALDKAGVWKQNSVQTKAVDLREFYEWKAVQALETFLLDFLSRDLRAEYEHFTASRTNHGGD